MPSFDMNFPILSMSSQSFPLGRETKKMLAVDVVGTAASRPRRAPIAVTDHSSRFRLTAPQSVSIQATVSSHLEILEGLSTVHHPISVSLLWFLQIILLSSPREVAVPLRQPVTEGGTTNGGLPMLQETNPSREPTTEGLQIWIEGPDFLMDLTPLYAKF